MQQEAAVATNRTSPPSSSLLTDDLFQFETHHPDLLLSSGATNFDGGGGYGGPFGSATGPFSPPRRHSSPLSPTSPSSSSGCHSATSSRINSLSSRSSFSSDLSPGDHSLSGGGGRDRYFSGPAADTSIAGDAMLKLELSAVPPPPSPSTASSPPYPILQAGVTTYVELRPSAASDFPTPPTASADQLSSSGESGYFDATSYTDLQAILDVSGGPHHHQQLAEQPELQRPVVLHGLSSSAAAPTALTPDATPEDQESERLEWTYLEPVNTGMEPAPIVVQQQVPSSTQVHLSPLSIMAPPHPGSQQHSLISPAPSEPGRPQQQDSLPPMLNALPQWDHHDGQHHMVQVKAEHPPPPPASSLESYDTSHQHMSYSVPVQLLKRSNSDFLSSPPTSAQQQLPSFTSPHPPPPLPVIGPPEGSVDGCRPPPPKRLARSHSVSSRAVPTSAASDEAPRLCHVCGEAAGKHSYYGGQVCPSCRAFFRRSVQSKYSDVYTCSKNKDCPITLKTRKNCQYCRFRRCERAGMKRSWVLADGPPGSSAGGSADKKGSGGNNKGGKSSLSSASSRPMEKLPTEPLVPLVPEDRHLINLYIEKMNVIKNQTEQLNPKITSEIAQMVRNKSSQMSPSSRAALKTVLEQRARLYALNLEEFTSLSSNDQITLLEANTGAQIKFRLSTFFHTEINWRTQVDMIMGNSDVSRLTSMLTDLNLAHLDQRLEYQQFFNSPWCHDEHFEKEHRDKLNKISRWVEDDTTFCLLNLMLLFSSSDLGGAAAAALEDRPAVERCQLHFSRLLEKYLRSRHGREAATARFAAAVSLVSVCRELHDRTAEKVTAATAAAAGPTAIVATEEK